MNYNRLALFGGPPIRTTLYPPNITTSHEELEVVVDVLKRGVLSGFEGSNNELFYGGPCVRAMEEEWADYFGVNHAIAVNSATSGLFAAVGAAGVGPGDEVITTPWTMTATATAIVVNHAVPVFADIERDTFCLSPEDVEKKVTPRTKAIIPVHIFGHPADMDPIMEIAKKYGLIVIEDAAQSPGAKYKGRFTSTIGDMGVHSLNANKIIQCGEGGVVMTNDHELALKLRLIRNHGEAVIATGMKAPSLVNMVGYNYRMNEIEAALSSIQLKKLKKFQIERTKLAEYLSEKLSFFKGLIMPGTRSGCDHTYYRFAIRMDPDVIPINAKTFVKALNAEGLDWLADYIPLNQYPLYGKQVAFGEKGCPFKCPHYNGSPDYSMDTLPNVRHNLKYSFSSENIRPPMTIEDMDLMVSGFEKLFYNLNELAQYERTGH